MSSGRIPSVEGGIQPTVFDAKGDLVVATAADTPARLAVGTNGQYLSANSSTSTGLEWVTLSAGGMTELASGSLTGSAVNLTSISGSYKNLQLVLRAAGDTNDNIQILVRLNNDSTANRYRSVNVGSEGAFTFNSSSFAVTDSTDNNTRNGLCVLDLIDYANTSTWKTVNIRNVNNDSTTATSVVILNRFAAYNQTAAISEINIIANSTFSGGTYILYGVK